MKKFIALLRGINVSGQKQIKMSELKTLFEKIGFQDVETYIQSGNVIFSAKESSAENLTKKISLAIKKFWDFDVQVIVLTPADLQNILSKNPFIKRETESDKLYVVFLSAPPAKSDIKKLNPVDFSPEEYKVNENCVYLFVPNGYGKAKLNNNFFEKKLKVIGTTRNWKTINKLFELSTNN